MSQQSSVDQEFRFSPSGTDWWLPSRSYFRIRVRAQGRVSKDLGTGGSGDPYQNMSGPTYEKGKLGSDFMSDIVGAGRSKVLQGSPVAADEVEAAFATTTANSAVHDDALQRLMSRVVPAKAFCASLFDTATVKIGDTIVSKVSDNKMHQIDSFKKRSRFSSSQLEGTMGEMGLYQSKLGDPCNQPGAANATASYETGEGRMAAFNHNGESGYAELMWQPPLGIFDYDRALPPSTYTIRLKTHSQNLLRRCIDWSHFRFKPGPLNDGSTVTAQSLVTRMTSPGSGKQGTQAQLLDWGIEEIVFYAAIIQGPRADDVKYALDLMETGCTTQQVTNTSGDLTLNFDVNANTRSLAWGLQGLTNYYHGDDSNFRYGLLPTNTLPETKITPYYDLDDRYFGLNEDSKTPTPPVAAIQKFGIRLVNFNGLAASTVASDPEVKEQKLSAAATQGGRRRFRDQIYPMDGTSGVAPVGAGRRGLYQVFSFRVVILNNGSEHYKLVDTFYNSYDNVRDETKENDSYPTNVLRDLSAQAFKPDIGFHLHTREVDDTVAEQKTALIANPGGFHVQVNLLEAYMAGLITIGLVGGAYILDFALGTEEFEIRVNGPAKKGVRQLLIPRTAEQEVGQDLESLALTSAQKATSDVNLLLNTLLGPTQSSDQAKVTGWSTGGDIDILATPQVDEKKVEEWNFLTATNGSIAQANELKAYCNVVPYIFKVTQSENSPCRSSLPISYDTNQLESWYISYDGKQYPSEHSQQDTKLLEVSPEKKKILLKQRWLDTITQNGTFYTAGQGESYAHWLQNGPLYYMTWPRQGTANATRLIMNLSLKSRPSESNPIFKERLIKFGAQSDGSEGADGETALRNGRVLLFYNYPTAFLIRTRDSRVVQVETPQNSDARFQSILD